MYTTFSVVESTLPPYSPVVVVAQFRLVLPGRRRFVQPASRQVLSSPAHEKHHSSRTSTSTSTFSSRTLSLRPTKSIPDHSPHLNLLPLPFYGFRSVPISDER